MKLLLTSNGITNPTIARALVELLGKPITDANALFVATGMYPFPGGLRYAWEALAGKSRHPIPAMGWKTFGNLELSVLPSIDAEVWQPEVAAADAIIVWGGDPIFLRHWLRASGLAIPAHAVYVGISAGSIVAATTFGETYTEPRRARGEQLSEETVVFPDGDVSMTFLTAPGMGWVDFAIIPHYRADWATSASEINAPVWAAKVPVCTYALDDASAIVVDGDRVQVVSEGQWKRFDPVP